MCQILDSVRSVEDSTVDTVDFSTLIRSCCLLSGLQVISAAVLPVVWAVESTLDGCADRVECLSAC